MEMPASRRAPAGDRRRPQGSNRGNTPGGVLPVLLALAIAGSCRPLMAQVVTGSFGIDEIDDDTSQSKNKDPKSPFVLPRPSADAVEAMEDFRRAVKNNAWEKAFKQLDKLSADSTSGLVDGGDGFKLPSRLAVAAVLSRMPAAGKNAYRLFYDAKAKALWEQTQKEHGKGEMEKLSRLASLDLITSVGDLASNRLGDVLFEQGDVDGAIDAWQRILEDRPDTTIPHVELLVKVATALARAGRWQELSEISRQIAERHAGESIVVAGKKAPAADYVAKLADQQRPAVNGSQSTAASSGSLPDDLALPDDNEPVWQFRLINAPVHLQRWNQWGGQEAYLGFPDMVVPAAIDGGHLYGNWLGSVFALDLDSGKLAWLSRPIPEVLQSMQQSNGMTYDGFELAAHGNQLWSVGMAGVEDNPGMGQPGNGGQLIRRDPTNGKELLNGSKVEALKEWLPFGTPVLSEGVTYVAAYKQNQATELHILALRSSDGAILWSAAIGSYQFNPVQGYNPYGMQLRGTKPALLLQGTSLIVDTHAGGVVELQAATGQIRWAYKYESESPDARQQRGLASTVFNPSVPLVRRGQLYVKGMHSSRLCALRLDGKGAAWKRSVPDNALLAGIDDERIFLGGEEVLAYDLKSQRLLWCCRLPATTSWMRPLLTRNRFYQFTSRGLYELDKSTGNILRMFRGADLESAGGAILTTPKLLITVSNRAITAYRLKPPAAPADPPAKPPVPTQAAPP